MRQSALLQSGRAAGRGSGEGSGCNRGESQAPKWLLTAQADLRQTDVMGGEVRGDHSVGWCSHSLMYDVKQLVPRDLMQFDSNGRTGAGLNIIVRVRQAVSFASPVVVSRTPVRPPVRCRPVLPAVSPPVPPEPTRTNASATRSQHAGHHLQRSCCSSRLTCTRLESPALDAVTTPSLL